MRKSIAMKHCPDLCPAGFRTGRGGRARAVVLLIPLFALLAACTTFKPMPLPEEAFRDNIHTLTRHDVTVSTTILRDGQAERVFGVDISDVGLQAIWLRIENRSDHSHWLLVSRLDPNYFAPDEAAVLFHARLGAEDEARLTRHFRDLAIPLKTAAGQTHEGYVLAPRHEGGRYLAVSLAGERHSVNFGFAVPLPDGDFDYEELDPVAIYGDRERPDLDLAQLRSELRGLPCCAADGQGNVSGDPLNLVLIGDREDMVAALARGGWSFTHRIDINTVRRLAAAAISGAAYPVAPISPLYFMDRPQDLALQRARNTIVQRNHLRLWLAPFRFQGESVWIGQVSRDISVKATLLSPTFTTHVIDPNVDEAREHLLQSLMVAGAVERFAFVAGVPPASPSDPRFNLTEDPYFTDGLRLVAQVSGTTTTPLEEVEFLDWQESQDPIGKTQVTSTVGPGTR